MVACLTCFPESLPRQKTNLINSPIIFTSDDAISLIHTCQDFKHLKQIHGKLICTGLSQEQGVVTNLLRYCSTYGKMEYARHVFDEMSSRKTTFMWNVMIRGFAVNGRGSAAVGFYNRMVREGVEFDKFTFPFVVKACEGLEKGKEVHMMAVKCGFDRDLYFQNCLIDFYFKYGEVCYGRKVFDKMRVRNVVSWTTVIAGYVVCKELDVARGLFEEMPVRNVVSWTVIIDGCARNGRSQEAFDLFWRMQLENVKPNEFTLVSLLIACTELGSLKLGTWVHEFALKCGFKVGTYLGTALIDMYSKCGSLEDAKKVFNEMERKSLATWNSMITSLGVHGCGEEALSLFTDMEMANVQPDAITFVGVLSACLHLNNVEIGGKLFDYMKERYGIQPIEEHYSCMLELHNRESMIEEAYMIE